MTNYVGRTFTYPGSPSYRWKVTKQTKGRIWYEQIEPEYLPENKTNRSGESIKIVTDYFKKKTWVLDENFKEYYNKLK